MASFARLRWLLSSACLLLSACTDNPSAVETTVPAPGQTNVPRRTVIAIRLSNTMSSSDQHNTDAGNILVTGDLTEGVYSGSIQAARHSEVFNGQTVDQFRSPGTAGTVGAGEEGSTQDQGQDTLVFLLDAGVEFKPGERVHVRVSKDITVRGRPFEGAHNFTFQVTGGASRADEEFFVIATDPPNASYRVPADPAIQATFSLPPQEASLEDAIMVRGAQSGFHAGGESTLDSTAAGDPRATYFLDLERALVPGEEVTVAFTGTIAAAGAAGTLLAPHLVRFQVRPGAVEAWDPIDLEVPKDEVVAVLPGEFLPFREYRRGVEFVVAGRRSLTLYRQVRDSPREWTSRETLLGNDLVGAVVVDPDGDGIPQVIVLLQGAGQGILEEYVVEGRNLVPAGAPVLFDAGILDGIVAADTDADGQEELFVTHEDAPYRDAEAGDGIVRPSGHLTIFEPTLGPPAGAGVPDLGGGLDDLLRPTYSAVRQPLRSFERSRSLEFHDLDNDGLLDLVNHAADGTVVLYRNQSSAASPHTFRRVRQLSGRNGLAGRPLAVVALDLDADGDLDLVSWDDGGALLHENRPVTASTASSGGTASQVPGLLFERVVPSPLEPGILLEPGDRVLASNIDGDAAGRPDLIVLRARDGATVLRSAADGSFQALPLGGGVGSAGALAVVDADGDTGLDVTSVAGGELTLHVSRDTVPPGLTEPPGFFLESFSAGDTVEVDVIGDITRDASGYTTALEYDDDLLQFIECVVPPDLQQTNSDFACCPSEDDSTCDDFVHLSMSNEEVVLSPQRDAQGNRVPWHLATFRFRKRQVSEFTQTEVEFTTESSGNRTFDNTITLLEDGIKRPPRPISRLGEPVVVVLEPLPPPPLVIRCQVERRLADRSLVRIGWSSERLQFEQVLIQVGGLAGQTFPWDQGAQILEVPIPGLADITVTATGGDAGQATAQCQVVNVFQPEVRCLDALGGTLITWTMAHEVDHFNVYRDGRRMPTPDIQEIQGRFEFLDTSARERPDSLYEVEAVLEGQTGPRGSCSGKDPEPCDTRSPVPTVARLEARIVASAPNLVRFAWSNGEPYSRLVAHLHYQAPGEATGTDLFGPDGKELEPTSTLFIYSGDRDRGGAAPGTYRLELQAFKVPPAGTTCAAGAGEVSSPPAVFADVVVPLPALSAVGLTCEQSGARDAVLRWQPPWRGYDPRLTLRAEHSLDGVPIPGNTRTFPDVLLSDTEWLVPDLEPVGAWRFTLEASYPGVTDPARLIATCGDIAFSPAVSTGTVSVPVGAPSFEIAVRGRGIFSTVTGFAFDLLVPDSLVVEGYEDAVPEGSGRLRLRIAGEGLAIDPDPDGDGMTDGNVTLLRLTARLRPGLDRAALEARGAEPLTVEAAALRFAGSDLQSVAAEEGTLVYSFRWAMLGRGAAVRGSSTEVHIPFKLTFHAPAGVADYRMRSISVVLQWDPAELEILPYRDEDQLETVLFGTGQVLALQVGEGLFLWSWSAAESTDPLPPVTDAALAFFRFRAREGAPAKLSSVSFAGGASGAVFEPVRAFPGFVPVQAFFDGGVEIGAGAVGLGVSSLDPARGPLTGGGDVTIRGRGFDDGTGEAPRVWLIAPAGTPPELRSDPGGIELEVLDFGARDVRVRMADVLRPHDGASAFRRLPAARSITYGLAVETAASVVELPGAYRFDAPSLGGTDVRTVRALGGDYVRLTGTGFSSETRIAFAADGVPGETAVTRIVRRSADGTSIVFVSPPLPAPDPGDDHRSATLKVFFGDVVPGTGPLAVLSLLEPFRILPGGTGDVGAPHVASIEPESGLRCAETTVSIRGERFGFQPEVRFGEALIPADRIERISDEQIRVRLPQAAAPETVDVLVSFAGEPAEVDPSEPPVYRYLDPPDFIRGDVDGSGAAGMGDATLLAEILLGTASPNLPNADVLDADDDEDVDFGDVVRILGYLFRGEEPLPPPFPGAGQDPASALERLCGRFP